MFKLIIYLTLSHVVCISYVASIAVRLRPWLLAMFKVFFHVQRKKQTHVTAEGAVEEKAAPATFVMERGRVGRTLSQLVLDLRRVMEPHTASRLKVG